MSADVGGPQAVPGQAEAPRPASQRLAEALSRFCEADGNDWGVPLRAELRREAQRPFSWLHWYRVDAPGVSSAIVVKAARGASASARETASAEASAAQRLAAVFAGIPDLGVVAPLRTYPDLLTVITPAIEAPNLGALIEARARWWPSAEARRELERGCSLAGRWLAHLHRTCPAPPSWTLDTLRDDLALRVRLLQEFPRTYGMSAGLARRIEHWIDARLAGGSPTDLACSETHRDYSPGNMLYDGQSLRVLDFGTLRPAPRLLDVTRFLHQVQLLGVKPRYRPATRRALQDAFASGYGDAALLASPLVPVFMLRHDLSHWLGAARRVKRRGSVTSAVLCRFHACTIGRRLSRAAHNLPSREAPPGT